MPAYWVKVVGQSRSTRVICEADADIDTLARAIKHEFAHTFESMDVTQIVVKSTDGVVLSPLELVGNPEIIRECQFLVDEPPRPIVPVRRLVPSPQHGAHLLI